jgi:isopenicillin N synthase-like dioxygenase
MGHVPVIDLSGPQDDVVKAVQSACSTSGFFLIQNHGVPEDVIARSFEENKKFFALPEEQKAKIKVNEMNRGWNPMQQESLDPKNQSEGDTKEGLYIGREVPAETAGPMQGPNQWPSPDLLPDYRPAVTAYFDAVSAVGRRLLHLLALGLGLPPTWFDDKFEKPIALLRPLHYSGRVSVPDAGVYGCGSHTDWGMLTILATDGSAGLQIHTHGAWEDVPIIPGTFIINLGDMLERWTNGRFKSTRHRVLTKTSKDRYSCAFFWEPTFTTRVECLPSCCSEDNPPKYPPTTSGEYLLERYAETQAGYVKPLVAAGA